ncbi:MAG TPA: pirin family protein [Pirellulales bacterium]
MFTLRKSTDRLHTDIDWLNSWHTFSFGDHYDPNWINFGPLRVINEDFVQPGMGFGMHPHRDMEIITYIVEGALEHKDSLGTGSVIRPGDVQRMTAGTGIHHSEFNPSQDAKVHLLQIWIVPEQRGLTPSYEQKAIPNSEKHNRLRLIASHNGRDGSVTIRQDTDIYSSLLDPNQNVVHQLATGRSAWLQLIRGALTVNGNALSAGDGAGIRSEPNLEITATKDAELLLFDLG